MDEKPQNISRCHARVYHTNNDGVEVYHVEDQSENGTCINDRLLPTWGHSRISSISSTNPTIGSLISEIWKMSTSRDQGRPWVQVNDCHTIAVNILNIGSIESNDVNIIQSNAIRFEHQETGRNSTSPSTSGAQTERLRRRRALENQQRQNEPLLPLLPPHRRPNPPPPPRHHSPISSSDAVEVEEHQRRRLEDRAIRRNVRNNAMRRRRGGQRFNQIPPLPMSPLWTSDDGLPVEENIGWSDFWEPLPLPQQQPLPQQAPPPPPPSPQESETSDDSDDSSLGSLRAPSNMSNGSPWPSDDEFPAQQAPVGDEEQQVELVELEEIEMIDFSYMLMDNQNDSGIAPITMGLGKHWKENRASDMCVDPVKYGEKGNDRKRRIDDNWMESNCGLKRKGCSRVDTDELSKSLISQITYQKQATEGFSIMTSSDTQTRGQIDMEMSTLIGSDDQTVSATVPIAPLTAPPKAVHQSPSSQEMSTLIGSDHQTVSATPPKAVHQSPNSWINRGVPLSSRSSTSSLNRSSSTPVSEIISPPASLHSQHSFPSSSSTSNTTTTTTVTPTTSVPSTPISSNVMAATISSSAKNTPSPAGSVTITATFSEPSHVESNTVGESDAERQKNSRMQQQHRRSEEDVTKEQLEEASKFAADEVASRNSQLISSYPNTLEARLASEEKDLSSTSDEVRDGGVGDVTTSATVSLVNNNNSQLANSSNVRRMSQNRPEAAKNQFCLVNVKRNSEDLFIDLKNFGFENNFIPTRMYAESLNLKFEIDRLVLKFSVETIREAEIVRQHIEYMRWMELFDVRNMRNGAPFIWEKFPKKESLKTLVVAVMSSLNGEKDAEIGILKRRLLDASYLQGALMNCHLRKVMRNAIKEKKQLFEMQLEVRKDMSIEERRKMKKRIKNIN